MSDTLSGEQMQAKIQAARREAEGLKDKIKRKKDELADTSRMLSQFSICSDGKTARVVIFVAPLLSAGCPY